MYVEDSVTCHISCGHLAVNKTPVSPVECSMYEPEDFVCPIGLDVMVEPVVILRTKQSYDAVNLKTWFAAGGECCPLTGVKLDFSQPVYEPNLPLQRQIQAWAAQTGLELATPRLVDVRTPSSKPAPAAVGRRHQRWQRVCRDVKRLGRILKENLRSPGIPELVLTPRGRRLAA